jgi:hypothetical protein
VSLCAIILLNYCNNLIRSRRLELYLSFQIFTAVKIQVEVLWVVEQYSVVLGYQFFEEPCCLHLQGEAVRFSEKPVSYCNNSWLHNPVMYCWQKHLLIVKGLPNVIAFKYQLRVVSSTEVHVAVLFGVGGRGFPKYCPGC